MKVLFFSEQPIEQLAFLRKALEQYSMHIEQATSVERLHYLALTEKYTAIIDLSAEAHVKCVETLKELRCQGCQSQYIVITRHESGVDRAKCLEAGVDTYFIEPFSYRWLVMEILLFAHHKQALPRPTIRTNYLSIDLLARTVELEDGPLELTKVQFNLLALLVRRRGIVLSRVEIWEEIWGYESYPLANTVDVHISRLRRKMGPLGDYLKVIYGIGYRLSDQI